MTPALTVGAATIDLLEQHDVEVAFGIPGVHTVELYRGLAGSGIRHITPRHEQGAVFMADGYAAVTGAPALCVLISGPGVTNGITGVAQAFHDSRPMLIVSSTLATDDLGRGRGPLHDLPDQAGLLASVCAISETVLEPERLPELFRDAFELFESKRPRPVHISIPIDVLAAPCPVLEPLPRTAVRRDLDETAIGALAAMLSRAERPLLLLGGGAAGAGAEAVALAERAGLPVLLTGNAKGTVPDDHELYVATTLCAEPAAHALRDADLVVAVGTELSTVELGGRPHALEIRGRLVRIDIDPQQLANGFDPTLVVTGDAGEALAALLRELPDSAPSASATDRASSLRRAVEEALGDDPLKPWVETFAESLPDDAFVAVDSAQLGYSIHESMGWSQPRSWLAPFGFGTLGPALPMALGAKAASPERPVVAVAGDGGALFTIAELATAAQHSLPVTYVIWNNDCYEQIRVAMDDAKCPPLGTRLTSIDFAALADSMGCRGVRADSRQDLGRALRKSVADDVTTVIDVVATA